MLLMCIYNVFNVQYIHEYVQLTNIFDDDFNFIVIENFHWNNRYIEDNYKEITPVWCIVFSFGSAGMT